MMLVVSGASIVYRKSFLQKLHLEGLSPEICMLCKWEACCLLMMMVVLCVVLCVCVGAVYCDEVLVGFITHGTSLWLLFNVL